MKFLRSIKRGFTLIETLIAILILATAIAGPLTIAAKGLQLALIAKDQMIATYLAEDGVEYVRFIRDTNRLQNNGNWLANLDGSNGCVSSNGSSSCYFDSTNNYPVAATVCAASCPLINFDSATGLYNYTTGTATIFTRTATIVTPSAGGNTNEAQLTVTVQWKDVGGITRSVLLRENLLNWQ